MECSLIGLHSILALRSHLTLLSFLFFCLLAPVEKVKLNSRWERRGRRRKILGVLASDVGFMFHIKYCDNILMIYSITIIFGEILLKTEKYSHSSNRWPIKTANSFRLSPSSFPHYLVLIFNLATDENRRNKRILIWRIDEKTEK